MSTITERVIKIVAEHCSLPVGGVREETELESLGLDSLTMLEVGFSLKKEFRVTPRDADLADAATVSDLIRIVQSQTSTT